MATSNDYSAFSAVWQKRFALIDKAGGAKMPRFKELTFGERLAVNTNVLALFFGPFYYLAKGMWRKAIAITAIIFALIFVLVLLGLKSNGGIGGAAAVIWSMMANMSYYKIKVLGEDHWL